MAQTLRETSGIDPRLSAAAVRAQLSRMLAHPLFAHSRRYPVLLAYIVDQALAGNAEILKERTIGVEAFGREPNYDVNVDPIVRATAAEVRKRLIQYYYSPEHSGEWIIELPLGSYIPSFREPASIQVPTDEAPAVASPVPEASTALRAVLSRRRMILLGVNFLLVAAVSFWAGRYRPTPPPSTLERFWQPITSTNSRVTYCLGEPNQAPNRDRMGSELTLNGNLSTSDVVALARSILPLAPRNGALRVVTASEIEFAQLREGPVVLIGAFDNPWTLRIIEQLPFGFEYDAKGGKVIDRRSNPRREWNLRWQKDGALAEDYAIVARIHDQVTGQPVIVLAGILGEGTEAASEVLSNPAALNMMLAGAPRNWDQLNLEAVISTQVIEGHPGPPVLVALNTW